MPFKKYSPLLPPMKPILLPLLLAACNSTPGPVDTVTPKPDTVVVIDAPPRDTSLAASFSVEAIDPPGDTSALYVYLPLRSDMQRVTTYLGQAFTNRFNKVLTVYFFNKKYASKTWDSLRAANHQALINNLPSGTELNVMEYDKHP